MYVLIIPNQFQYLNGIKNKVIMEIHYKYLPKGNVIGTAYGQIPPEKGYFYIDFDGSPLSDKTQNDDNNNSYHSDAELVMHEFHEKIKKRIKDEKWDEITLVSHLEVDLDSAGSLYYITRKLENVKINDEKWRFVVEVITNNDRGYVQDSFDNSIPAYFKTMHGSYFKREGNYSQERNDYFLKQKAFPFFDEILTWLEKGISPNEVCKYLTHKNCIEVRSLILAAKSNYKEDLGRSIPILLKIPIQEDVALKENERILVDALILYNPSSFLFKEFARTDVDASLNKGYTLMVVHRNSKGAGQHVISVDPASQCSLRELGGILEINEREFRQKQKRNYEKEENCHSSEENLNSKGNDDPWYDGRDHGYTIIDTPRCGSVLTDYEVNEVIWEYGNPLKDVTLESIKFTIFIPFLCEKFMKDTSVKSTAQRMSASEDILPTIRRYFPQAAGYDLTEYEISEKFLEDIKSSLLSIEDSSCDAFMNIKSCMKSFKCERARIQQLQKDSKFTGRITIHHEEELSNFSMGYLTFTYERSIPINLNEYMCLQFEFMRRFRSIVKNNKLYSIISKFLETLPLKIEDMNVHELRHWGEYIFSPLSLNLKKVHDLQETILILLTNGWPQTLKTVMEGHWCDKRNIIYSDDGNKLICFGEHGGGVIITADQKTREMEEKRSTYGYLITDYFSSHSTLVSFYLFACYQKSVIACIMDRINEWLDKYRLKGTGIISGSDEFEKLTGVVLKKEYEILADYVTYSKAGNEIFSHFRNTLHVDILKEQLEADMIKLNNWLVLSSNKDIAEKSNKILKETEVFEKKQKWIEIVLEITILPYYLYHIFEFIFKFLHYFIENEKTLENVVHGSSFVFTAIFTFTLVRMTISKRGKNSSDGIK